MAREPSDWESDIASIRSVLMSEWNPIGCRVPDDECDSYIPTIYQMIQMGVSVDLLSSRLQDFEMLNMGLPARPDVNHRVANHLINLWDMGK